MFRALVCAVGFLTRLPVPALAVDERDVARGAGFFAWVGVAIAAVLWVMSRALSPLGPALSALCLVALWAFVTGGLHLDGLADTVDGLSGGHGDRERTLSIMRDSRIGAHAAVALSLLLGLKSVALARLLESGSIAWLTAPVIARLMTTILLASFSYARAQGLGSAFAERVGVREVALGSLTLVGLQVFLGAAFWIPAGVGALTALGFALRARSLLGGLTGDVHGAALEATEVAVLLAACWPTPFR
jgi:adenosylcobinamide-GDP ribazoletransferase